VKKLNFKSKKFWLILIIVILIGISIFGGIKYKEKKEQKYLQELLMVSLYMYGDFHVEKILLDGYSKTWETAIDNGGSFVIAVNNHIDRVRVSDHYKDIKKTREKVENGLKMLQDPPGKYEESYNNLLESYSNYSKLLNQVEEPTGSLRQFNENKNQLQTDFQAKYDAFFLKLPADASKARKEYEDKLNEN